MIFWARLWLRLSNNTPVEWAYLKTEKDMNFWNFAKIRKKIQIPYQNEHKNCSLRLKTQTCNRISNFSSSTNSFYHVKMSSLTQISKFQALLYMFIFTAENRQHFVDFEKIYRDFRNSSHLEVQSCQLINLFS